MPSKYIVRNFIENGYYHIFNRGVEGLLFKDDQDYRVFLFYLFIYTSQKDTVLGKYPDLPLRLESKNLNNEIKVLGYSLLPNHFHLLLQQQTYDAIPKLMKQIVNGYTLYFNEKYKKEGPVCRGRYKAVRIDKEVLVIQLWRYIHLCPIENGLCGHPAEYEWSSYKYFMGEPEDILLNNELISKTYKSEMDIENYHTDTDGYKRGLAGIAEYIIEEISK